MSPLFYAILAFIILILTWFVYSFFWGKPWTLNLFYSRVFLRVLFDNPEILTMLGLLERFGIHRHNARLSDESQTTESKIFKRVRRDLDILRSYRRKRQGKNQLLSTDILDWYLDNLGRGEKFRHHNYPVNQMFGIQSQLPDFMMNMHPLKTRRDARNYIKRLSRFGTKIDQVMEGLLVREEKGCLPPNFTVIHVVNEMEAFIDQPSAENPLYTVFKEKMSQAKVSEADLDDLLKQVEAEIEKTVYPEYRKLIEYFTDLEEKAVENHGVWSLPDGDEYYAHCLRDSTSTDMTPDEVHQVGLREVERIEGRMSVILEGLGRESENPAQQLLTLGTEERFLYPNTDQAREACLVDYAQILEEINQAIQPYFDLKPKAGLEVKRIPEFKEATSPRAYYQPADLGGSRPGVFFANLRDMKEVRKFGMKTLSYHEGIPGHHFQIAIAQGLKGMPFFRRMIPFNAYVEGWAMYAENLAQELGMYRDDPYAELGFLSSILFRAVRLVVDTGIHFKRWTREKAIEYMEAHTGQPTETIISEVERYFVMPGQACAYKVGELKMLELREKAEAALGDRFDLREFHNLVLGNGAMPLSLLEDLVKAYTKNSPV